MSKTGCTLTEFNLVFTISTENSTRDGRDWGNWHNTKAEVVFSYGGLFSADGAFVNRLGANAHTQMHSPRGDGFGV